MLSAAIGSLGGTSYTVTRTATGPLVNGRYTPGSSSTFPIVALVQPLDPRESLPLPEGVRTEDVRLVLTATALRVQDGSGQADTLVIGGETYYVWKVEGPWTLDGSTHYEAHAARRAKP